MERVQESMKERESEVSCFPCLFTNSRTISVNSDFKDNNHQLLIQARVPKASVFGEPLPGLIINGRPLIINVSIVLSHVKNES